MELEETGQNVLMKDVQFRALLNLWPELRADWPLDDDWTQDAFHGLLNEQARERGFSGLQPAYHEFEAVVGTVRGPPEE